MKLVLVCLFISLSLAMVQAGKSVKTPHFISMRPPLGHFRVPPYHELYKQYVAAFLMEYHQDTPLEDSVNYVASAIECVNFFTQFRINNYTLNTKLEDFALLDACLGYLYESTYHEVDKEEDVQVRENLDGLIADPRLNEIYNGTKIEVLPDEQKDCVLDMLYNSILGAYQFKHEVCNADIIQSLVQFASCQQTISEEDRRNDSYLKMLFEMVKKRGVECFHNEVARLNRAFKTKYDNNPYYEVKNKLSSKFKKLHFLTKQREWPVSVGKIFFIIQQNPKQLNTRLVSNVIRGVTLNEGHYRRMFFETLTNHTNKYYKRWSGTELRKTDTTGTKLYERMVDKLCQYFRSSDNPNYFDFAGSFIRLNRLISYPKVLGVTPDDFIDKVLKNSFGSGPMYLCCSYCNLLSFTQGAYATTTSPAKPKFVVNFKPDLSEMVTWPVLGYY